MLNVVPHSTYISIDVHSLQFIRVAFEINLTIIKNFPGCHVMVTFRLEYSVY